MCHAPLHFFEHTSVPSREVCSNVVQNRSKQDGGRVICNFDFSISIRLVPFISIKREPAQVILLIAPAFINGAIIVARRTRLPGSQIPRW